MPTAYERANQETNDLLTKAMEDYHPVLAACEVTVDILMVSKHDKEGARLPDALKHNGYPCLATVKVVPLKQRVLGQGDALLTIDETAWGELSHDQRIATLDHELEHLEVASEDGGVVFADPETGDMIGQPKADDIGRPTLKVKLHDYQIGGFKNVTRRHKESSIEHRQIEGCRDESGQLYWEWGERAASIRPVERKADAI